MCLRAPYVHPLALKEVVCLEDLAGESVLTVVDSSSNYWSKLNQALESIQPTLTQHISIDTSHTAYSMVATGLAVGVLEPFATKVWEESSVITRPFEPAISYPYGLAYPTNTRHRNSLNKFTESLKLAATKMPEFSR
ncbi:LysR substrate-binding domain-containing protein [Psychromonas sp. KJ10-10]|uniref:LysR substrate-binding domain-containing protein n=1 Tax=Psychromonas sp. KJ10-10 TaxID=3391823 RepID=UPI0039B66094